MDADILNILACPKCRRKIVLLPIRNGLLCEACAKVYPIEDDVSILIIEQAVPLILWKEKHDTIK